MSAIEMSDSERHFSTPHECFSEMRRIMTTYFHSFEKFHLELTIEKDSRRIFSRWCKENNIPTITHVLPYGNDEHFLKMMATVVVSKYHPEGTRIWQKIIDLFRFRWSGGEIIGFRIDGIGFNGRPSTNVGRDFAFIELYSKFKENTDLLFHSSHSLYYSAEADETMTVIRLPFFHSEYYGERMCLMNVWPVDVETEWLKTYYSDQHWNLTKNYEEIEKKLNLVFGVCCA